LFEEVFGIPMHPLLVHAAVIFIPLQILAGLAYAFVPFVRRFIAWAVIALAVVAPLSALFAKLSGTAFEARQQRKGHLSASFQALITQHSGYGTNTLYYSIGLGVLMILLVAVQVMRSGRLAHASAGSAAVVTDNDDATGATSKAKAPLVVAAILTIGVLAVGAATGYYVFKTGDSGAHMVWSGY
jgi:hypothetical protein